MKRIASILAQAGAPLRGVRCTLALSLLLSLLAGVAGAGVRDLVTVNPKVSWTGSPQVIYLHADGTAADESDYDHLALKYTDTSAAGTLTIAEGVKGAARVLLVGGGGAGGTSKTTTAGVGGGGGAGGFVESEIVIDSRSGEVVYDVVVGAGGPAADDSETLAVGANGFPSSFGTDPDLVAEGGGGGGAQSVGNNGASGGGGSHNGSTADGGTSVEGQGMAGGSGKNAKFGGGGGGAGASGGNTAVTGPGKGGVGKESDILLDSEGNSIIYAGGGSGASTGLLKASAGKGGGGAGAYGGSSPADAQPGVDGLGGGGGGGNAACVGGKGGSGVVIVRITQLVETQVPVPVIEPKTFNNENQIAFDFGIAYIYVSGDTNKTNVGEYSFVVKPGQDFEWDAASGGGTGEKTVNWSIVKRKLEKPTVVSGLFYDGTDKIGVTYADEFPDYCTFDASSVTNATNAGTYSFSVSLDDTVNTLWADGTTEAVAGTWTISPVKVAQPQPKTGLVYSGDEQAGFASLDYTRYELTAGATNATEGGTYSFTFTLLGNDSAVNYVWDTDPVSSDPYTGEWSIAAAPNEITSLSVIGWKVGDTTNAPTIKASWGADSAVYSYGFGSDPNSITEWLDDANAVTNAGTWVLRAVIPETSSWASATETTTFVMWDDPATLFHNHVELTVKGATSQLVNFIVPIRISASRIPGFSYEGADPSTLAFVDKDGNLIPHEVDIWDVSGESVVWVKLATLPTTGKSFEFYWNLREGQTAPDGMSTEVWSDYAGVWHMTDAKDSAAGASSGTLGNKTTAVDGVFGGALSANQQGDPLILATASEAVNSVTGGSFTVSFYTKYNSTGAGTSVQYLFSRRPIYNQAGYAGLINDNRRVVDANSNTMRILFGNTWNNGGNMTANKFGMPTETWIRNDVYFRGAVTSGRFEWWINGVYKDGATWNNSLVSNGTTGLLGIGGLAKAGSDSNINGAMDEFRIRAGEPDINRIAAEYASVTNSEFVTSGVVYEDGLKVDYWVVEPSLKYPDMLAWDIDPDKNVDKDGKVITNDIAAVGQLRYGDVTNYICSAYDESEVYKKISEIAKGGVYRAVFKRVQTEDFQPLEYVIEFKLTQSQPYTKIGGTNGDSGRILLMNRDANTQCPINYQGFDSKNKTQNTFWDFANTDGTDLPYNLQTGTECSLWTKNYGERLWHLVDCRHGNTYPVFASGVNGVLDVNGNKIPATATKTVDLQATQNYLPYSLTSYSIKMSLATRANPSTAGQIVMRNMEGATVYSPCYTNGIGTIYFDAVNGWTGINDNNNIVVEIATNTVDGLPPTDAYCMTVTTNYVDTTEVVTTNWYGKFDDSCWHPWTMRPFVITNGVGFFETNSTKELSLQMDIGGRVDCFYRIVVPVDYRDAIRFRIRRTTYHNGKDIDKYGLILLDNIIASPPAMGGSLLSPGHYDGTKSGKRQLGWELATSVPYPSITDDEVFGGAVPTYYVNYGDGTAPNTNEFFHSAKMHYRWSYLGQVTNDWSTIVLNPADGFKATSAFEIPGHECDMEYWYEYILQAPYYSYVDYSGVGKTMDYTEERGLQTNVCANGTVMASGGTNWFFRVRDGRSDYSGVDIVYRREGSEAELRAPMMIVGDNVWRGFVQTTTNLEGRISWRIEAHDRQTEPYAAYAASTSHYYCTTADLKLPVSDKLEVGSEASWSALDIDALTGYVMFQIDDESLGLTVVHADYQNFNAWSDAKGQKFVGNSTADDSKSGTSPKKQTFAQDFDAWKPMSATNPKWMFTDFDNIRSMLGRTAYDPFESDDDGLWECGPGMWVSKAYRNDAAGTGVALQMEGQGRGFLRMNDVDDAPRGVESVSFNARLGQFVQFRDFNCYNGDSHLGMTNYTFMTRVAFDRNSNKDFKGNASLSIVADYLQNKGCYEARWEWIGNKIDKQPNGNKGQRLCLYRWNVTTTGAKETLLTAWTNTVFNALGATSLDSSFMPFYITVSNDTKNACTWVAAAVRNSGIKLSDSWSSSAGWYVVACRDASSSRLVRGTYGVVSANCDGVFGRPQFSTQTMLAAADELKLAENKAGYYSNKTRALPTTTTGNISDKTAGFGTEDTEWNIMPGRMKAENGGSVQKSAIVADPAPQTLSVYTCTAGKSDWGKTALTNITLTTFGDSRFALPLYTTKNCGFKFTVGGLGEENRTDIVIDTVSIRQFRGDDYADMAEMLPLIPDWTDPYSVDPGWGLTNWVFTSAWITNTTAKAGSNVTTNGIILLSARRVKAGDVSSIRSPLMDGYEYSGGIKRGVGLGMVSYDYQDAQSNAVLLVQIATNDVRSSMLREWDTEDDSLWTTVATNDFSKFTPTERTKGTISTYIGLHGVKGLVRIVVDPNLARAVANVMDASRFGEVKVTKVVCRDEPALDSACWWGWNLRTVGTEGVSDVEGRMYLPDYATDAEDVGMSLALNNSTTEDVNPEDAETYRQHVPFVQTPTFASEVVGEVSFKARRYDTSDAQPASVTLYGSVSGAEDSEWTALTNITVESSVYRTYTYKASPSSRYAAFRLGVAGVHNVKDTDPVTPPPVRVMIDEVFVSEAVYARMAFRNVGTIRNRDQDEALNRTTWVAGVPGKIWQPLCKEGWGVQCEVYAAQLSKEIATSFQPEVVLHWFEGTDPWGFERWKGKTAAEGHKSAPLAPATDTNSFYRSSYESSPNAVVPMSLKPGTVVQYMLEVRYRQTGSDEIQTNYLTNADWERPDWYRPVDFNADLGGGEKENFSAYCILDTVAPGWAWINEVNLFGGFDDDWNNSEENCQFVEIAAPVEADLTDWKLVFYGGSVEGGGLVTTNVAAIFGTSELPGTKPGTVGSASNMVFRVIACPNAETKGVLKKSDGTLDATWSFETDYTDNDAEQLRALE